MKNTSLLLVMVCFLALNKSYSQNYVGELAKTEFNMSSDKMHFFVNMFETKKQFFDFLGIKNGEVIAEVGSADGYNLGILSVFYDSLTLYAQDIGSKFLTQKKLDKVIDYYSKQRASSQTCTFKMINGTISSTGLPSGIFDKVFLINAYHDFDEKDIMIEDIADKLKPNGQIIILDGFSFIGDTEVCFDNNRHVLTTLNVELKRFEKHGFYLNKMRSPDYNGAHYGNALVLEKNKLKSDEFYKKRNAIEPIVAHAGRFKQNIIATDTIVMKQIRDSILPYIPGIIEVYPEYELWIKDIALRHMRKSEIQAGINILKSNVSFFPGSYQSYYWLGLAYQENKQYEPALKNLKQSLSLNPSNKNCIHRIETIEKRKMKSVD